MKFPQKILIIRFSSIGDIVLTSPVIRCIKQQFPEIEIHFATKKQYLPLLEHNPYLKTIHVLDQSLNQLIKQLKNERFDLIIDLHHNLRTLLIKLALGTVRKKSFNKINIRKWLAVKFKLKVLPAIHIVDRYLDTVGFLNIKNDHKGLDYFLPKAGLNAMNSLPETHRKGFYVVVVGAKQNTKKIPLNKMKFLIKEVGKPVVLIGGKEDEKIASELEKANKDLIWNMCGKMTLHESAFLVSNAAVIVSPDTGFMHIACAFKKPVISVWGNTIPAFGMYPYYGQPTQEYPVSHIIEQKDLPCRPCSKLGYKNCPKKHFYCMNLADEIEIASLVLNYFNTRSVENKIQ